MTTTTDTTVLAGEQVNAAGALLALLTSHPNLPAPNIRLNPMQVPGTYEWTWGLHVALHDRLDHFEQWRTALGLAPSAVDQGHRGNTAWLTVAGAYSGVPIELHGFYRLGPDAER
ncbi:hypothetical protein ACFU7Y_10630 [Kitasatospora sp. NPDC057542]|uniref:hypothetical protein n=1 Tax=Kitasatospora sp. NPDC057542 TaxID=3346162 RepID=UPI00367E7317